MMNRLITLAIVVLFAFNIHAENVPERVMLIVDVSNSMLTQDIQPDRLQSAKKIMEAFVNKHPNTHIGLTVFAGKWKNLASPSLEHKQILSYLTKLKPDSLQYGDGTATGSALISAASCLINHKSNNSILLITDGIENGGTLSTSTATEILKYYHIKLNVIALGTNGKARYPFTNSTNDSIDYAYVKTQLDSKRLSKMARTTGGVYFEINSKPTYQNALNTIGNSLWLKPSPYIKPSDTFHMTKEKIEWLIKEITRYQPNN